MTNRMLLSLMLPRNASRLRAAQTIHAQVRLRFLLQNPTIHSSGGSLEERTLEGRRVVITGSRHRRVRSCCIAIESFRIASREVYGKLAGPCDTDAPII